LIVGLRRGNGPVVYLWGHGYDSRAAGGGDGTRGRGVKRCWEGKFGERSSGFGMINPGMPEGRAPLRRHPFSGM